jgi:hypothetical protein
MDIHPHTLVLPTSHFLDQPWHSRKKVHDRLWRIIFRLPRFYDPRAVLASLEPEPAQRLGRYLTKTLHEKRFAPLYQLYPLIYSLSPKSATEPKHFRCWCDKSNSWRGLELIMKHFPLAKFIFIVRDPRSVVLSHAERAKARAFNDKAANLDHFDIIKACMYWRAMMQSFARFSRRHPNSAVTVRYEDFVHSPGAMLDHLFTFAVGESVSAEVLEAGLGELRGGATNAPEERYRGVSTAAIERWRTSMSASDVELVAALTWPTAKKLGYDVSPPEDRLLAAKALIRIRGQRKRIRAVTQYAALTLGERANYPFDSSLRDNSYRK